VNTNVGDISAAVDIMLLSLSEFKIVTQEDNFPFAFRNLSEMLCNVSPTFHIKKSDQLFPLNRNFDIDVIYNQAFQTPNLNMLPNIVFIMEIKRSFATKLFVIAIAITDCT
jgi:hypothetical protein